MPSANEYIGSSLDKLLQADGTLAEVERVARERIQTMKRGAMVAAATAESTEPKIEADSGNYAGINQVTSEST